MRNLFFIFRILEITKRIFGRAIFWAVVFIAFVAGIMWAADRVAYADVTGLMIVQDVKANGTAGGGSSATAYQIRTLNTVATSTIDGASLSSNVITLPAGTYHVQGCAPSVSTNANMAFWVNQTAVSTTSGLTAFSGADSNYYACVDDYFSISGTSNFVLKHKTGVTAASTGLGEPSAPTGYSERYSQVVIYRMGTSTASDDGGSEPASTTSELSTASQEAFYGIMVFFLMMFMTIYIFKKR